ncbi:MAG: hypothetical protein AB7Q29_14990 [Vicinamibacterales bacterium]
MSPWRFPSSRPLRPRAPGAPPLEKTEQQHIIDTTKRLGGGVVMFGVPRRGSACPACGTWVPGHRGTQQTEGAADLELVIPRRHASPDAPRFEFLKWETKSVRGRLSPAQVEYRELMRAAGVICESGTYDGYLAFLLDRGVITADSVPHYRLPASPMERD